MSAPQVSDRASARPIQIVPGVTLRLELPDGAREVRAGASYGLPADVAHGADAGADGCGLIEAFSPPRAAWTALLQESGG